MLRVEKTAAFQNWISGLRDRRARNRIAQRISRIELGNFGDATPVGEGVSELRIHHGPGYRVYFMRLGEEVVVLLGGGDKSTQVKDITAAKELAKALKE